MRHLTLAAAMLLASCSDREDCTCPPAAPVRLEMLPATASAVRTISFEPAGCGSVVSETACRASCGAEVIGLRAGLCTIVVTFDDGGTTRVSTSWDTVSEGGCCGTVLAPRDRTLIVVHNP